MFGLGAILKIVTFIPTSVRLVERLFVGKSGADKHDAAIEIITAVLPLVGATDKDATADLTAGFNRLISAIVLILHAVGEFKHKDE